VLNPHLTPEAFFEAFTRDSSGYIAYIDRDRRLAYCNESYAQWQGHPRAEILGKSLLELFGAEVYAQYGLHLDRAFAGERVRYERLAHRPNGSSTWISVTLDPHRDGQGEVVGVFSCALEVNELKRTHDALDRALQELASHMENTPLAVVEFSSTIHI
jgi:PAS domain S-box-containing protein